MKRRAGQFIGMVAGAMVAILTLGGCSLRKAAVDQHSYLLLPATVRPAAEPGHPGTLKVLPVTVAAAFEAQGLVYRWDEVTYRSDFYHQFLVPPRSLATERLTEGLRQGRPFETVVSASSPAEAGWWLEMTVTAFYGDWRTGRAPAAVVEVRYELLKAGRAERRVVGGGTSKAVTPLSERTPVALVKGLSAGLDRASAEIAAALKEFRLEDTNRR